MALSSARIQEAEKLLTELLGTELAEIIKSASASPGTSSSFVIDMPEASSIDFNVEELASLVARTSNKYGRVARFAGMARAELKLAEGRYKRKYKSSLKGKNIQEREANAIDAASTELAELNVIEAVVELAEVAESYARIASESARKLLDKVASMDIASRREQAGYYMEKDFD